MRTITSSWAGALVASVLAISCSSDETPAPITDDQACTDAVAALCAKFNACAPLYVATLYGDTATCEKRGKDVCLRNAKAPGTGVSPGATEACGQSIGGMTCDAALGHSTTPACTPSGGTLANGSPCGDSWQCQSGRCSKDADQRCGICKTPAGAGNACANNDDCSFGLVCSAGGKTCVEPANAGETCGDSKPCVPTLTCKLASANGTGTCAAPAAAGAPCNPGGVGQPLCDGLQGYVCHTTKKVCIKVGLANPGETCGFVADGYTMCAAAGFCKAGSPGTCLTHAEDGASCNTVLGPTCLSGAECVNGVCQIQDPSLCK